MNSQDLSECIFDISYLSTLLILTTKMFLRRGNNKEKHLITWMCFSLAVCDCIQLVPRMVLIVFHWKAYSPLVDGIGFLSGAIGITLFQRILLEVLGCHYEKDIGFWHNVCNVLVAVRMVLLLLPNNDWLHGGHNAIMTYLRNIPVFLLGAVVIYLLFMYSREKSHDAFRWMWLHDTLSFVPLVPITFFHVGGVGAVLLITLHTVCYITMVVCSYRVVSADRTKSE